MTTRTTETVSPPTPTQQLLRYFQFDHLPSIELREVSSACAELALQMESMVPNGPEKTAAMRKLLEAKDSFVRATLPQSVR